MVILAENGGRTPLLLLEDTVEIADIVEAAGVTNLCYAMRTVHQHSGGMPQADVYRVFRHRLVRVKVKEAAESRRRHACQTGQIVEADLPLEILIDILLHLAHPAAVVSVRHAGEALARQQMIILLDAQLVEQIQKRQDASEPWLRVSQTHQLGIHGHDGVRSVGDTQLGVLHHLLDGTHGVLGQELLAQQILAELDGYLMNLGAVALVLLPDVLQPASHQAQVIFPQHLHRVAHDAACPLTMGHKIQFQLLVLVQGIREFLLVALHQIEAVLLAQVGDFRYDLIHDSCCAADSDTSSHKIRTFQNLLQILG